MNVDMLSFPFLNCNYQLLEPPSDPEEPPQSLEPPEDEPQSLELLEEPQSLDPPELDEFEESGLFRNPRSNSTGL
jgi:hypothetical protein